MGGFQLVMPVNNCWSLNVEASQAGVVPSLQVLSTFTRVHNSLIQINTGCRSECYSPKGR